MLDSILVAIRVTLYESTGSKPTWFWMPNFKRGFAIVTSDPVEAFYRDLEPEEARKWAKRLRDHSLRTFTEGAEHVYAGWMDLPVWYLVCYMKGSPGISHLRRSWAQNAKHAGADIMMREIKTSHSPMLSRPKETVEFMMEALSSFSRA